MTHEDPHEHIRNVVDVCAPFSFNNISQELVRLRFLLFSSMGEACEWVIELPRDSITSWEELLPHSFKDDDTLGKHRKLQAYGG